MKFEKRPWGMVQKIYSARCFYHYINLLKTEGGEYYFEQSTQNDSEYVFTPDELRDMCEKILAHLDSQEK